MKPATLLNKILFILLVTFAISHSCFTQQTVSITNVWELYMNLGSHKVLELDTGVYDLGILLDQQYENDENRPMNPKGANLINVHDLTIKGKPNGKTKIVVDPDYYWVVYFHHCKNITLTNIVFGHSPAGHCKGGVLKFVNCTEVEINSCDLFGSGTVGLALDSCSNFKVSETTIHDCTHKLMDLYTSGNIRFNKVQFKGTRGGVVFMNTPEIYFSHCDFENNDASSYHALFYMCPYYAILTDTYINEEDLNKTITMKTKVYMDSCSVRNNTFHSFTNDRKRMKISGTKMENNTIPKQ